MTDDGTLPKITEPPPSSSSSSVADVQGPKTINVNVDLTGDRWVVVSYENEKGERFHGILLKANEA